MSRSLIVGLLTTSVLVAAPVPKEDDAARMTRIYGTTHDPDKGSDFKPARDSLRIAVPHEPRLLSPWCKLFNAPRVWREVNGNFAVTVRVSFPVRPKVPAKHEEVKESRAGGGLVVWGDEENFLTVTRDERAYSGVDSDGKEPGEYFRIEVRNEARACGSAVYSAPGQTGYLRVQRKGKVFEGSYSTDGKKWTVLQRVELEWADKLKVGVFAENSFKAPFELVFDEYALTLTK